jgi:hypothetical protein
VNLNLGGHWISRVIFENAVVLETLEGDRLRFGGRVHVTSPDQTWVFDESTMVRAGSDGFLLLLQRHIMDAFVDTDGSLHLEVEGGVVLVASPDPHFESWEFSSQGSPSNVVSMPGGELAIWD